MLCFYVTIFWKTLEWWSRGIVRIFFRSWLMYKIATPTLNLYPCSLIILLWYTRCSATSCQAQAYSHPVLITYICLSKILIAVSPIFVRFIPLLYCYVVSLTWASVDDDEWFLPLFLPVICCVSKNEIVVTHHRIWNRGQTAS